MARSVPGQDRQECGARLGRAPGVRQLRRAQDSCDPGAARQSSALPCPLHPHRLQLRQPGPRWFGHLTDKLIRRGAHTRSRPWKTTPGPGSRRGTRTRNRSCGPRPPRRSCTPSPNTSPRSPQRLTGNHKNLKLKSPARDTRRSGTPNPCLQRCAGTNVPNGKALKPCSAATSAVRLGYGIRPAPSRAGPMRGRRFR